MATVAAVGPADALEIKSSDVHAMGYPTTDAIQFMGEWLSEKTDGELSINIFHSMQLGALEMTLAPLILICTPILLPVIKSIGVDPVHFGFIIMLNLGIGLVTAGQHDPVRRLRHRQNPHRSGRARPLAVLAGDVRGVDAGDLFRADRDDDASVGDVLSIVLSERQLCCLLPSAAYPSID